MKNGKIRAFCCMNLFLATVSACPLLHAQEILYYGQKDGSLDVWVMDADGTNKVNLSKVSHDPFSQYEEYTCHWSPDGKRIAFISNKLGPEQVWIMDADGSNDYCLTNSYQQEYEPIWSPDGTKIYFSRSVLGGCDPFEIFAYDLNTGLENRLTYNFNRELTPIVSPDGQFIVYAKGEEGHSGCSWMDVWIMRVDGSNQHLLYGASYSYDWPAAWGKANNRILIKTQSFNGMCQVALINPDGSDLVQLTETRYNAPAAFSPDEQKILFTSNNCPIGMNVFVMNIDGSNVVQLTEDPWENWANDWRALSRYTFEGFFSPIDNIPTVNKANAGQAIPVKWRITDKNGLPVSDPASFKSITSYSVSCSTFAGDPTSEVDEYAAGSSGLQYLGDGWWQFNWKTAKTYKGQCRIMKLTLDDHSVHTASFSFK